LELVGCKYNSAFSEWVDIVCTRVDSFKEGGWHCIVPNNYGADTVNHWKENHTWKESPIFIDGKLVSADSKLWLVE
jgi:ABC-type Fe3+-citrate transport system substrate-binding protein